MISFASTSSFCCDFALHVLVVGGAEDVGEAGAAHLVGDHLRGEREIVEDARELARRFRVIALLLDDEALDRDDRRRGVLDHVQAMPCEGRLSEARCGEYRRASTSYALRDSRNGIDSQR